VIETCPLAGEDAPEVTMNTGTPLSYTLALGTSIAALLASCALSAEGTGPVPVIEYLSLDGSGDAPVRVCSPGEHMFCTCPSQPTLSGARECNADGLAFGACTGCPEADASTAPDVTQPDISHVDARPPEASAPIDAGSPRDAGSPADAGWHSCVSGGLSCTAAAPCCTLPGSRYYGICTAYCY
jgi:hypothetical protein